MNFNCTTEKFHDYDHTHIGDWPSFLTEPVLTLVLHQLTLFYLGGHYGPPYHESVCCCRLVRATLTKLLTLFLSIFARSQKASLGVCFSKNWTSKILGGPWALGENQKISKKFIFSLTNSTFSSSIWIVYVLSFHLRCITPLKLKILIFFYYNIDWNLPPSRD